MSKRSTPKRGNKNPATGSKAPTGAARPDADNPDDKLKEPPAGNAGGSTHKSTARQPSMNKNTGESGQKQPHTSIRDKMKRPKDLSSIKGVKQAVSDAYSVRVAANKVKRDALAEKRKLKADYDRITRNAEAAKRELNTAIFKRDGTAAEIYEAEYEKLQEDRRVNANKRRAESVRASRADKLAQKMEAERQAYKAAENKLRASKTTTPKTGEKTAPQRGQQSFPVDESAQKTPATPIGIKTEKDTFEDNARKVKEEQRKKFADEHGFKLPDINDIDDPFPVDAKPMADSTTLSGGDKLINDAGSPDSDDDDTEYGGEDNRDISVGSDLQREAAEIIYDKVVYTGQFGDAPDYDIEQHLNHQNNIIDVLVKCDKEGILYRHNGINRSVVDAIIDGADPVDVWDVIMGKFNYDSEYFPYKSIVEFD